MGSSATDNFCLRWNDFAENVSGAFKDLRAESDFFDVTLACTDSGSRTLQAHKVILSACSSFFKTMLRQQMSAHKHPNPYIYLRGVSYNDLASVLDFIYNGEVNVAQEDLNSFLAVAEELQIKGLTNRDGTSAAGEAGSSAQRSARAKARDSAGPPAKKFKRASPLPSSSGAGGASAAAVASAVVADEDDVKEISIKDDPEAVAAGSSAVNPDGADVSGTDFGEEGYDESYDGYYEGDDTGEMGDAAEGDASGDGTKVSDKAARKKRSKEKDWRSYLVKADGIRPFACDQCGRGMLRKEHLMEHIQNVHGPRTNETCYRCGKSYKNAKTLRNHLVTNYCLKPKPKFYCNECPKQFVSEALLRKHQAETCYKLKPSQRAARVHKNKRPRPSERKYPIPFPTPLPTDEEYYKAKRERQRAERLAAAAAAGVTCEVVPKEVPQEVDDEVKVVEEPQKDTAKMVVLLPKLELPNSSDSN